MQEAVPVGKGNMLAILGSTVEKIKKLIDLRSEKKVFAKLLMIMRKDKLL